MVGGYDETAELPPSDRVASDGALPSAVGRFVVRGRLGEGGMGVVLDAYDPDLDRRVAIKLVRGDADSEAYRARLSREAAAMARVEHPNVVKVYEVGSDRGRMFVAMELVEGITLRAWLAQPRPRRDAIAMFEQVGAGLAAVHRNGLVHRDFKPDNVLVDRDGRARVADFGLARLDPGATTDSPALAASLTRTGAMMGTPGYMPPEQQVGGAVDARADQYAFCVALREALAGDQPRRLRALLARGLAYDPSDRFASMDELLAELRAARSRGSRIVIAAVAILLVGGGATATALALRDTPREPRALAEPSRDARVEPVVAKIEVAADAAAPQEVVADAAPAPKRVAPHRAPSLDAGVAPQQAARPSGSHEPPPPKPEQHEMPREHLAAVRAAIRDLGYTGVTITGEDYVTDRADLKRQLDAAGSEDHVLRGRLYFGRGLLERKHGDCGAAIDDFDKSIAELASPHKPPEGDQRWKWIARCHFNVALCSLEGGRALASLERLDRGTGSICYGGSATCDLERAQTSFAHGVALWETGNEHDGKDVIAIARGRGDAALRATIEAWWKAVAPP